MRAVGDQHDHVHLGAQVDVLARRGNPVFERQAAVGGDRHVHEEVDVRPDVALAQAAIVNTGAQVVVAAAVHVAFFQGVAHGVALLRTGAAEGVVTPASVGDDGQHRLAEVGIQHAAGAQVHAVLTAQGALHVVAFLGIGDAVEQGVDGLIAFQIEDAQGLAGLDLHQPGFAGGDGGAVDRGVWLPACVNDSGSDCE
ncbi:hypothetical protein D3C81_1629150 [compost metagenome]